MWQIHEGTVRYFSYPVATKTYTQDIIAPHITVCHEFPQFGYNLDQFSIKLAEYLNDGIFSLNNENAEEIFTAATEDFYYVLDGSGKSLEKNNLMLSFPKSS